MLRSGAARLPGLLRPQQDDSSIRHVANLISAAFTNDPFIRWLRPRASPIGRGGSDLKFQYRRVQHNMADGVVLKSESVSQLAKTSSALQTEHEFPRQLESGSSSDSDDFGVALMLFPPEGTVRWTRKRIYLKCKLWILDMLRPVKDKGSDKERIRSMMNSHYKVMDSIRAKFGLQDLWYLEVIAVHPALQGMGIGKKAMQCLLEYVKDQPIVLECTQESTVDFYRKFAFEVFEITTLRDPRSSDPTDIGRLWVMVKRGAQVH